MRDLWSTDDPQTEARLLLEACRTAAVDRAEFSATIEVNAEEARQLDFLRSHGIVLEERITALVERRRQIRAHFDALAQAEGCATPGKPLPVPLAQDELRQAAARLALLHSQMRRFCAEHQWSKDELRGVSVQDGSLSPWKYWPEDPRLPGLRETFDRLEQELLRAKARVTAAEQALRAAYEQEMFLGTGHVPKRQRRTWHRLSGSSAPLYFAEKTVDSAS